MSDQPPLRFLTSPEPGIVIFNATDEQGRLQRFTLSKDQLAGLAVEATRLALQAPIR
jgi:hypothetical protein